MVNFKKAFTAQVDLPDIHARYTPDPGREWSEPWEYEAWKAVVLDGGKLADEEMLRFFFDRQQDPHDCVQMMQIEKLYSKPRKVKKPVKPRVVVIDFETAQRRVAVAIWRECARLILRHMTPEARVFVTATQKQAESVWRKD